VRAGPSAYASKRSEPPLVYLGDYPQANFLVTHEFAELGTVDEVHGGSRDYCSFPSSGREPGEGHQDGPFCSRCCRIALEQGHNVAADRCGGVISLHLDGHPRRENGADRRQADPVDSLIANAAYACELKPKRAAGTG